MIKVVKAAMTGENDHDLPGGGEDGDHNKYFYDDWGVDHVDLDFKTGKNNQHCSST